MILGIDASNIREAGGLTHLKEILLHAQPENHRFEKVIVWSNKKTLAQLPDHVWLHKRTHRWLEKSFVFSYLFQIVLLTRLAVREGCSLLFVPGGTFLGSFRPVVSMSQNMLPFEKTESARFADWKTRLKFRMLYWTQTYTFKKSKAVIFLTHYAENHITKRISLRNGTVIIPHGINLSFLQEPKVQKEVGEFSAAHPYRLLYVSVVKAYKHQWNVAEAVLRLRKEGFPVRLDLVGGHTEEPLNRLKKVLEHDVENCIEYKGEIPYEELNSVYKDADAFVFASSCENMPIILIEAMTSGLPVASSNRGPMKEVLGDAGFYFDPLSTEEIYRAVKDMIENAELRSVKAAASFNKSRHYSWKDCSERTFAYLSDITHKNNSPAN